MSTTVKEIIEKFEEFDNAMENIEGLLNNTSTGVDFYNACKSYYSYYTGSIEQREAIIDIFSSGFKFSDGKIPDYLAGFIISNASWFMDVPLSDYADDVFKYELTAKAYDAFAMSQWTKDPMSDKELNELIAYAENYITIRDAIREVQEINQFDQIFYDIGLVNPLTGEIDITVYNNWEDVLAKYIEENNLSEDRFDANEEWLNDLKKAILIGLLQSFKAAKAEKPCTPIYSSSIFFSHIFDPLILDLDGDGYNVENKENGTNFDLDKNGFAEKINWTTRDGFSTKINVKPS